MDIKTIRTEYFKMSQKEFADRFSFNIDTIQNWEQGRTKTPEYVIVLLLNFYHARERIFELEKV